MGDSSFSNPIVIRTFGWLYAFLLGAWLVVIALRFHLSNDTRRELLLRVRSWWMILILTSFGLLSNKVAPFALFSFVSFLALREFLSIIPVRSVDRGALFWVYLAIPLQYTWAYLNWFQLFTLFIPLYLFMFLSLRLVLTGETKGIFSAVGTLQWVVVLSVFSVSHIVYLFNIAHEGSHQAGPVGLILYLLALTQLNDVFQYIFGKLFGRRSIVPKISPKKTWEGLGGGVLMTTLLSFLIAPTLTAMSQFQSMVFGMLISLSGFFGDITMSAIKRDLKLKDTGKLLPGHGGILDRIDSLMFSSPLFFYSYAWICL